MSVATVLRSIGLHLASLLGAVTPRATIAAQLPTDSELVASDQAGDLRDAVLGFHKTGNLAPYKIAEVFVGHKQKRLRIAGKQA